MLERHHENSQCRLMTMPRVPGVEAMGGPKPVPALRVRDLHKSYGSVEVLRGISLDIAQGSVVTLLGASRPAAAQVTRMRTKLGMVFQQFNLGPHMTVLSNVIEAPLRVKRMRRAD